MSRPASSTIFVSRIASCADDSTDRGSCRIRLPASTWSAAGIPYHKPVIVSIPCEDSSQPWRLLCTAALAPDDDGPCFTAPHADRQQTPPLNPPPASIPQTPQTPPKTQKQKHSQQSQPGTDPRRAAAVSVGFAVVDPSVVARLPPGRTLEQLRNQLAATHWTAVPAEVAACRGAGVAAATEARLRVPPGQDHLASPRLSFKLHQALVLPGCWVQMAPSCYVEVVSVLPEPQAPDQPLRIVPSTRLTLVGRVGEAAAAAAEEEEQVVISKVEAGQLQPTPHRGGQQAQQQERQQVEPAVSGPLLMTHGSAEAAPSPSSSSSLRRGTASTTVTAAGRKAVAAAGRRKEPPPAEGQQRPPPQPLPSEAQDASSSAGSRSGRSKGAPEMTRSGPETGPSMVAGKAGKEPSSDQRQMQGGPGGSSASAAGKPAAGEGGPGCCPAEDHPAAAAATAATAATAAAAARAGRAAEDASGKAACGDAAAPAAATKSAPEPGDGGGGGVEGSLADAPKSKSKSKSKPKSKPKTGNKGTKATGSLFDMLSGLGDDD
ncbi:hypothetical protein PLESTB_000645600 [Pleodorina starrii]|uniref:Uncharacterized protein n=1 Tax=Pleodorina starrii TaxID=330485 RepID=A0A9W6BJI7_9CHLO|nr:hypothetical protein PLESTM_001306800 [Pleodorina starrii]GLC52581.1 hypothetical protein PLESTB_000645600 [Pleodorina starrii]GLC71585.1 hypothetical protein PLESTF_001138100 [Pleodorina starrii]